MMQLLEILQSLHQMHKTTTKLLFEGRVNQSEDIRRAVAKADLALGDAAGAVRQGLSRTVRPEAHVGKTSQHSRRGLAVSRKSSRPHETGANVSAAVSVVNESLSQESPSDQAPSGVARWEALDMIRHPDDRLPRQPH